MAERLDVLRRYVTTHGLRMTRQREVIAEVLLSTPGHLGIDELYAAVKARDGAIGYATLYRTVKLLQEAGLAESHDFGTGGSRFEASHDDHHDHLVCTRCRKIVEFHDEAVERLQEEIAARFGYRLTDHRMELYGLCGGCA